MNDEKNRIILGRVCAIFGAVFIIAGIVFFIMSNFSNLQMEKTEATIIAMYEIDTQEGDRHTMLELSYRVGSEVAYTTYEYPGILDEGVTTLELYYNIKQPTMLFDAGWYWSPLWVLLLGIPILCVGLYYMGILKMEMFELSAPDKKATNMQKELYMAKKTTFENILPMLAGVLFVVFGIIMFIKRDAWWTWVFIVVGAIELLYIGMEFIPALVNWISLSRVNKFKSKVKAKVYDVEVDSENDETFDKKNDSNKEVKNDKEESFDKEGKTEE